MGDTGRDTLESLWSEIFSAEDSLIRQQIVSGTHAISLALFAMLLPNDEIVFYGPPYDTLFKVLGDRIDAPGTLREMNINIKIHPYGDLDTIFDSVTANTKVLYLQRSKGYVYRNAMTIGNQNHHPKGKRQNTQISSFLLIIVMVNLRKKEPLEAGGGSDCWLSD